MHSLVIWWLMYCTLLTYIIIIDLYSGGSRGGARGTRPPPHLFLDQTGAWRAKKKKTIWKAGPTLPPPLVSKSGSGTALDSKTRTRFSQNYEAFSKGSDSGVWREVREREKKGGNPPYPPPPPRCFFVLISLHAVPTIWAPGIGLILSSAHRWTSIILAGKRNSTEIKIHVYAKRQTWICTTRPMFPLIFRLLFIAPTRK